MFAINKYPPFLTEIPLLKHDVLGKIVRQFQSLNYWLIPI